MTSVATSINYWPTEKLVSTIIAGVIPFIIVVAFVWFRLPRLWMSGGGGPRPNMTSWFFLLLLSFIWLLLGISVPIALYGVDPAWWTIPMINLVFSLLPFFFISLQMSIPATMTALAFAILTIAQYSACQKSWVAAVCSAPYLLWCLASLWTLWCKCSRNFLDEGKLSSIRVNETCPSRRRRQ